MRICRLVAFRMIRVWRTTKRKYVHTAFDGEGARLAGGRFNRKGTPLVYTAWTLSLSILEILAQVLDFEDLEDYVAVPAVLEERHVDVLDGADLPTDWRALPAPTSTKDLGTRWIRSMRALVLRVPSVIVPSEHSYLINPEHPDFGQLVIEEPWELEIDQRLFMR